MHQLNSYFLLNNMYSIKWRDFVVGGGFANVGGAQLCEMRRGVRRVMERRVVR